VAGVHVRDGMSRTVLMIGPGHTLREASRQMTARHVGAAVINDPDGEGSGILTERDILEALAAGADPDTEAVAGHLTGELVYASPDWTLEQAAAAMMRGGFRHLVVLEGDEVAGILSVRDIVRVWAQQRASADLG
jgi:CBS domain-containing protein